METAILRRLASHNLNGALLLCDDVAAKHLMFLGMDRVLELGCTQIGDLDFNPENALFPYSRVIVLRTDDCVKLPRFDCSVIEVFCTNFELQERYKRQLPSGALYCPLVSLIGDDIGLLQVKDSCAGPRGNDVDLLLQIASALDILDVDHPTVHCIGDELQAFASFLHDALQINREGEERFPCALVVLDRRLDLISPSVPSPHEYDPATDDWSWQRRMETEEIRYSSNTKPIDTLWQSIGRKVTPNCLRNADFGGFNEPDLKHAMALLVACAASVPENAFMRDVALPNNIPHPPLVEELTNEVRDKYPFKGTLDNFVARALMGDISMHTFGGNIVASLFGVFGNTVQDPLKHVSTVVFVVYGGVTLNEVNELCKVREQLADSRRIVFLATEFARPDIIAENVYHAVW